MNCCLQKSYTAICIFHMLYIIQFKTSGNIQELQESIKYIKSYQENKIEFLDRFYFTLYFI